MFDLIEKIKDKFSKKEDSCLCFAPFLQAFISKDGRVYNCPDGVVNNVDIIYLGDLKETTFEKIWNGSYAKLFRKKIKKRDYTHCYIPVCANRTNFHMQVVVDYYKNKQMKDIKGLPKIITFGEDSKYIQNCIMDVNETSEIDLNLKDKYFKALETAEYVVFSHKTDPFSNKNTSGFIKEIAQKYPSIKFNLVSNGILFNKENCDNLGITNKLKNVLIFIGAAEKETYDKYIQNGDFDVLKQNLEWLKSLKQEGKLSRLFLAFPVDENNFREMPKFVELAKEYDAIALFWLKMEQKFNVSNVSANTRNYIISPMHENYAEFIDILNSNNFSNKNSSLAFSLNRLVDKYS